MKPIPVNKRWLEARENHPEGMPPAPSPIPVEVVVLAMPVLEARYEGTCPACGRAIQPGMPITRHAQRTRRWVHLECREAPLQHNSLPARYEGFCRACRQPIQVGEMITDDPARGWIHLRCAQHPAAPALNAQAEILANLLSEILELEDDIELGDVEDAG
jgi:hypothetical protein